MKLPGRHSPIILSLVVLSLALAGTWLAVHNLSVSTHEIVQSKFDTWTGEMTSQLNDQIAKYVNVLEGSKGLYAASKSVERNEWEAYITSLDIAKNYPGIDALSFAEHFSADKKEEYIARVKADDTINGVGYPDFQIHPDTVKDVYDVVTYVEPMAGNEQAFGFNLNSEATRAEALERARDSGEAAATRKITLVKGSPGFLIVLPVYTNTAPITTLSEKRSALLGYVVASFRTDTLFQDLAENDAVNFTTHFEIFDGATTDDAHILYESGHHDLTANASQGAFTKIVPLSVAGNIWTVRFFAPSDFGLGMTERYSPWLLAGGGVLLSLILSYLVYTLAVSRARALKLAETMTADLRTTQERLRSLYEITTRSELSLAEQLREALRVGASSLHTTLGVLSHITDGTFTVLHCHDAGGNLKEGMVFKLAETYCDITVKNNDVVAIDQMTASPYQAHACYTKFKLESYIGVPILVNGELFGTLAFLAPEPHHPGFTDSDHDFVRLMGKWVATTLEHERLRQKEIEINNMKSEFVSVASHQLRTPLTGIKWFGELLLKGKAGALTPDQKDFIQQMFDSNTRMINLVNDLLNVSRIDTGKKFTIEKKPVDLVPIVQSLFTELVAVAEQHTVTLKRAADFPTELMLTVDGEKIRQVIQNLLSNAVKYSKENGVVEITCDTSKKTKIIFSIKDTGLGIPAAQQPRMFEKFFRADNVQTKETEGTGLGLYIAKAIVEGHGGEIWFESQENVGTTFYFSLPRK